MKKMLKQTNRGLILFGVLLIGVIVYLIVQAQLDQKLEPKLQAIAENFIADTGSQVILPEELRKTDVQSSYPSDSVNESLARAAEAGEGELSYYSSNDALREYTLYWLQDIYDAQIFSESYILSSQPEITKFGSFSVYKGKATLEIRVTDTYSLLFKDGTTVESDEDFNETLTFEKEDGRWVITNYETYRLTDGLYMMDVWSDEEAMEWTMQ